MGLQWIFLVKIGKAEKDKHTVLNSKVIKTRLKPAYDSKFFEKMGESYFEVFSSAVRTRPVGPKLSLNCFKTAAFSRPVHFLQMLTGGKSKLLVSEQQSAVLKT